MWFTCEGEKQRDAFLHFIPGGGGLRRWNLCSSPPRGEDTGVLQFLAFNFSVTSGRWGGGGFSLIKVLYSWNECRPRDSGGPLRQSRLWQAESAVTATSSLWLAERERGILSMETGGDANSLNTESRKKSLKVKLFQLLFGPQRYHSLAVITWLAARGAGLRSLWEYSKYR